MVIEPLTRAHDRRAFDCGEPSLNRFLREVARQYAERDIGVTYVAVPDAGDPTIVGYYTLTMGDIESALIPQKGLPPHQPIPILLLGRLAVSLQAQGRRLGERLLFDALYNAQQASAQIGCFAVVVDALNDSAAAFYARYGFQPLLDDSRHLFLPLKEIRKMGLQP